MESHSRIEDAAAEWLARRDSGHWSDSDEANLQEWLGMSTAHRVAYLRLKATWETAGRLRALRGATTLAGNVPLPGEWRRSPFFEASAAQGLGAVQGRHALAVPTTPRRHRRFGLAVAASVSFLLVAGVGAYHFWLGGGDRYTTPVGGLASVPMSDGSNITLNTDSVIRVAITERERRVQLERGEAFFDVAKDRTRPFVVHAGDQRIVAVGTKFSVRREATDVQVLVTEGKVLVESADSPGDSDPGTRVEQDQPSAVLVAAGSVARVDRHAVLVQSAPPPQVEEILSWREGYLRFHETVLADAVAEMNRYNRRKIVIEDPELAALRISGTFRPTQYEAFVRVLQDGFAIHARDEGDRITLTDGPQRL